MTKTELKNVIADCCNDVVLTYLGKPSGITSEVNHYIPIFQVWHGKDLMKDYDNIDDVMNDPFYSGKLLNELVDEGVDFQLL